MNERNLKGRNFMSWLYGEQFAVLCYSRTGALKKVVYFDYLFDAQTFCTTCKCTHEYDELEIFRMMLTSVPEDYF